MDDKQCAGTSKNNNSARLNSQSEHSMFTKKISKTSCSEDSDWLTEGIPKTCLKHDRLLKGRLGARRSSYRSLSSHEFKDYHKRLYTSFDNFKKIPQLDQLIFYENEPEESKPDTNPTQISETESDQSVEIFDTESYHSVITYETESYQSVITYETERYEPEEVPQNIPLIHLLSIVLAIALFSSTVIVQFGPTIFSQSKSPGVSCTQKERIPFHIIKRYQHDTNESNEKELNIH